MSLSLDDELRDGLVVGDVRIGEPARIQPCEKPGEILGRTGFDPDQDRTKVAGRFLQILKPRDVVVRTQQRQEVL